MTENEKRTHRCCFTGHRPEKLTKSESIIKELLEKEIRHAFDDGLNVFISGMARGTDIWAANSVINLRRKGYPIKLICASPYKGFEHYWCEYWQKQYNEILNNADLVRFICPKYSRSCFQIRNEWMIDHSARVIAVFNGTNGGTKNSIDYAMHKGVQVKIIY